MEKGAISKEFFIGRFLYLKDLLDNKIPNVRYTTMNGHDAVSFNAVNKKTGKQSEEELQTRIPNGTNTAPLLLKEPSTKNS